jgi:hypothetical protein
MANINRTELGRHIPSVSAIKTASTAFPSTGIVILAIILER